ncbi:contractile injection system tape measure protein [Pseudorhodoferax sp. LjRoot39]|uniref:contractile injection system tape measure protein n=1 Tax=Pseudorhodoferax sp. LjRoot39 TaxID=3342328 RepID=UPI003ED0BA32
MPEEHLVEQLTLDVGFAGERALPEAETRLAAFMQGPALAIVDAVFGAHCGAQEVWRIDTLALDLGEVPAERMEELWAQRLHAQLAERLAELRGPAGATAGRAAAGATQRSRAQARLEALLYFLQHGHLPWHAQGEDPARLAEQALQHSPAALAEALRAQADRPRLLRRLAVQFAPAWRAALVQALLPDQPAAAQRLLQATRAAPGLAPPWEAVLALALGSPASAANGLPAGDPHEGPPDPQREAAVSGRGGLDALQALLHYLRHGHLPWQARGDDPQRLAAAVLQRDGAALAAALRAMDDRPQLLRRLAAQFDADVLAALVHALLPGEPGAAARLLRAAAAAGTGRRSRSGALLWEAVLAQALAHPAAPHALTLALLRAQLRVALRAGVGAPDGSDPLLALAAVWAPLLQDDRAWLQATLQRLGDGGAVRQRLERAAPPALLQPLLALWLGRAPDLTLAEEAGTAAATAAAVDLGTAASSAAAAPAGLAALLHYLRHGHWPEQAAGADPQQLATAVLQRDGAALAAALRGMDARPQLLRRLAAQFGAPWLAALVRALLPDAPAAVERLLQAAAPAGSEPRSAEAAWLWEAVLAEALDPVPRQPEPLALLRAQLRLALQAHATVPDPLVALQAVWAPLLRHDRAWLQGTLQRLHDSTAMRQRMARVLPGAQRQAVMALWLGEAVPTPDALQALLHCLQHGQLPAPYGAQDAQALADALLQHDGAALARGLRAIDDRPLLGQRLATQFTLPWLAALVHALLPGAPAEAAQLVQAAGQQRALWQAVLGQALAHGSAQATGLPVLRAELLAVLASDPAPSTATATAQLARAWAPLWQGDRAWLQATLQQQAQRPAVQQRIVQALAEEQRPQLLALWFGPALAAAMQGWIGQVAAGAPAPAAELSGRRQQLWQASLQHALQGGAQAFDAEHYAQQVRRQLPVVPAAGWFDRAVRGATALLARAAAALGWPGRERASAPPAAPALLLPPPELPSELAVGNAGLVLLAPYQPRLFMLLGLADARAFTGPEAAERAVQLLQLLVTGEADAPEPALVLNKLLCGLDQATPVARRFEPTAAERSAIDGLLAAVVQHWKVLGSTSPAGLRETFLQRPGRLQRQDEAWRLQVLPGPFDMLIDQLPWGYATIRHPWMEQVLHVDWR